MRRFGFGFVSLSLHVFFRCEEMELAFFASYSLDTHEEKVHYKITSIGQHAYETNRKYLECFKYFNRTAARKKWGTYRPHCIIEYGNGSCIRDLALNLNIPKTTVHRMIKELITQNLNSLHPSLKGANNVKKLEGIHGIHQKQIKSVIQCMTLLVWWKMVLFEQEHI